MQRAIVVVAILAVRKNFIIVKTKITEKCLRTMSGFTQAGVYARRQFCADLEVYRPPEPL